MHALVLFNSLLSSFVHESSTRYREECFPNGTLVCHGEKQFGLCNNGKLVWQDVAPGTICRDNTVMHASLLTEWPSITVTSASRRSTETPVWTSPPPDMSGAPTISISLSTTVSTLSTPPSDPSSTDLTSQPLTTSLNIPPSCPAVMPTFWNTSVITVSTSISSTSGTVYVLCHSSAASPTQNVSIASSIELPSSSSSSNGSVTSALNSNSSSYTSIEMPTSTDMVIPSTSYMQDPTTNSKVVSMPSLTPTQTPDSSLSLSSTSAAATPIEIPSATETLIDTETIVPTESPVFTESPAPTETPIETPEPTEAPLPTSRPISWWTSNTVVTLITVAPSKDPRRRV
ncbi:hypothetical protein GRF29_77g717692 [Pseudopithomyces chartarum]|uniref:Uncharacterized protein n=1 Tax=Pseudopithomyces chartarum TaxID=1892770 RepID=A0AAN6LX92_9PLEO|nr:hypothetical protein GRF29_77g717692 [Pseudopithomyces chartarum]